MKKIALIIATTFITPAAMASDSVYSWGDWSQGLKPAAGPSLSVTPPPAEKPQVNFRPNENSNLTRTIAQIRTPAPVTLPTVTVPDVATNGIGDLPQGTQLTSPEARNRR